MEEILLELSSKYLINLEKQSESDKESNKIYGKIIAILIKNPNINMYELVSSINIGEENYEKNKIRNRRDRITGMFKIIEEANQFVTKLLENKIESLEEAKNILKVTNIFRNRVIISLLLDQFFTEEFYDLYYLIKNDQCKGFLEKVINEQLICIQKN